MRKKELPELIQLVDSVMREGSNFTIGIISLTVTSPEHRKKGYASMCLNDCIRQTDKKGIDLSVLWTMFETFAFYEGAEYQGVRSQGYIYKCEKRDAYKFKNNGEKIVQYNPKTQEFLDPIQKIHEKETTVVARNVKEYEYLFNLPKIKTFIAVCDNKAIAYLIVSNAVNKPGLIEGGGEEKTLETLINYTLNNLDEKNFLLGYSYLTDSVLSNIFEKKLPDKKRVMDEGPMMIRINDIGGFMRKISKWLETKNSLGKCSFSIKVDDYPDNISFHMSKGQLKIGSKKMNNHFEMARRKLTSVLFGQHPGRPVDVPDFIKEFFTLNLPIWILDRS